MENQDNVMSANLRRAQTVKDDRVKLSCLKAIEECQEKIPHVRHSAGLQCLQCLALMHLHSAGAPCFLRHLRALGFKGCDVLPP